MSNLSYTRRGHSLVIAISSPGFNPLSWPPRIVLFGGSEIEPRKPEAQYNPVRQHDRKPTGIHTGLQSSKRIT